MSVLVHGGDVALRAELVDCLERAGWPCEAPAGAQLGTRLAAGDVRAIVVDLGAADAGQVLAAVDSAARPLGLVALVSDTAPQGLVDALRAGATQLLRKPFGPAQLECAVALAARRHTYGFGAPPLLAVEPRTRTLVARIDALACTDLSLALHGESGTGKTRVARWLHAHGARRAGRLVEVPCDDLCDAELELFGAGPGEPGRLSDSAHGSLVLDDPARLSPRIQTRLLEWLEHRAGQPLPRVITTSRGPLSRQVTQGRLLPDLAERLAVVELELPTLAERRADIPPLARELAAAAAAAAGEPPPVLDDALLEALAERPLAGNVRQLESLMQRAALLFPGRPVDPGFLERPAGEGLAPLPLELPTLSLDRLERLAIARALELSQGNRTRAARALGINVRTLRNKLRRA